jgi:hypothetical protein
MEMESMEPFLMELCLLALSARLGDCRPTTPRKLGDEFRRRTYTTWSRLLHTTPLMKGMLFQEIFIT